MRAKKGLSLTVFLVLIKSMLFAQAVTGIVTDQDGKKLQSCDSIESSCNAAQKAEGNQQ